MFEFQVHSLRDWRIRLGRRQFRTWRPWWMKLPHGYRGVEFVYQVVAYDDDTDEIVYALAAFDTEFEARKLMATLDAEGRHTALGMNVIPVHARAADWEFDR